MKSRYNGSSVPRLDVGRLPAKLPVGQPRGSYSENENEGLSDCEPLPLWIDLSTAQGQVSEEATTETVMRQATAFPGPLPLGFGTLSDEGPSSVLEDYRNSKAQGGEGIFKLRRSVEAKEKEKWFAGQKMNFGNYSAGNPPLIDAAKPAVRTFRIDQHQQHNPDGHSLSSMVMQGADLSDKRDDAVWRTLDTAGHIGTLPLFPKQHVVDVPTSKFKAEESGIMDYRNKLTSATDVTDHRVEATTISTRITKDHRLGVSSYPSGKLYRKTVAGTMPFEAKGKCPSVDAAQNSNSYSYSGDRNVDQVSGDTSPVFVQSPEIAKTRLRRLPSLPARARTTKVIQPRGFSSLPKKIPQNKKEPNPDGHIILILTMVLPWLGDDARDIPGEFMEQRGHEGLFMAVSRLWYGATGLLEAKKRAARAFIKRWIRQCVDDALVRGAISDMVREVQKRAMYSVRFKRYLVRSAKRLAISSCCFARRTVMLLGVLSAAGGLFAIFTFACLVNNVLLPVTQLYLEYMFPEMREGRDSPIRCMHVITDSDGDLLVISGTDDGCAVMWNIISPEDPSNSTSSSEDEDSANSVSGVERGESTNAPVVGNVSHVSTKPQGYYNGRQKLHGLPITCLHYFRDHTKKRRELIATGCQDGSVRVWSGNISADHVNFKAVQTFSTHTGDEGLDDESLEEWEQTTKEKRLRKAKFRREDMLKEQQPPVTSLHSTASGYYLAAGFRNNEALMWVVESAEVFARFRCDESTSDILCVQTFQCDMKLLLATGNDSGVSIWGVRAGWRLNFLEHQAAVTSLRFLTDDKTKTCESIQLVTGDEEGTVRLWASAGELLLHAFSGHCRPVKSIFAVSEGMLGERALLTSSADGSAKLWSIERKCVMATLMGNKGGASSAFAEQNDDGHWKVVVASRRGFLNVWDGTALRSQLDEIFVFSRSKCQVGERGAPDEQEIEIIKEQIATLKQGQQDAEVNLAAAMNELEIQRAVRDERKMQEESLKKTMSKLKQDRDTAISKYKRQAGLEMGLADASSQEIIDSVLLDPIAAGSAPLLREIAVLHVEVGKAGEQLGECKRELRGLRCLLETIPDEIKKQQENNLVTKKRISDLEMRKDKMVNDIRRHKQRTQLELENAEQELASVNSKIERAQGGIDVHARILAEANEEGGNYRKQALAHRKKTSKLSRDIDKKQKAIDNTIEKYIRQAKETHGTPEATSQAMVGMVLEGGRSAGKDPLLKQLANLNQAFVTMQDQLRLEDAGASKSEAAAQDAESRGAVASEQMNLARGHLDGLLERKAALDGALQGIFARSVADNITTAAGRAAARKAIQEETPQITLSQPSEVLRHMPVCPFLATAGRHLIVFLQLMAFPMDKAYHWHWRLRVLSRICEGAMLDFPATKTIFVIKFTAVIALIVGTAYTVLARDYRHEWRLQWRTFIARFGTAATVPLEERREWLGKIARLERNMELLTYLHTFITTVGLLVILRTLMEAHECSKTQNHIHRSFKCGSGRSILLIVLSNFSIFLFGPMLTLGFPYQGVVMPKINRIPSGEKVLDIAEWQKWFKVYLQQTIAARLMAVCEHLSRSNHTLRFSHYEQIAWEEYCAALHRRSPFVPSKSALLYNFSEGCVKLAVCITHTALAPGMPVFGAVLQLIAFGTLYRLSYITPPYRSLAPNLWVQGMNLCLAWSAFVAAIGSSILRHNTTTLELAYFVGIAVIMLRTGEMLRNISGNFSSLATIFWVFSSTVCAVYATTAWAVACLFSPLGFACLKLFLPCILRIVGVLLCDQSKSLVGGR